MPEQLPPRSIQQISFRPEGVVEVQYVEGYDQGELVAKISILAFEEKIAEGLIAALRDDISDLIDAAIDALRDPPKTLRPGRL